MAGTPAAPGLPRGRAALPAARLRRRVVRPLFAAGLAPAPSDAAPIIYGSAAERMYSRVCDAVYAAISDVSARIEEVSDVPDEAW